MKRKTLVVVTCALLIIVLVPLFYYYLYVPYYLGRQYVLVSFRPAFMKHSESLGPIIGVFEGKPFDMGFLSIEVDVTNNYIVPVHVRYNGFDIIWIIYNQTVSDASDVLTNRLSLVWGAYYYLEFTSYPDPHRGVYDFSEDTVSYYADRRGISNFTMTIDAGKYLNNYDLFGSTSTTSGAWSCQYWFSRTQIVSLGTYYMYCIIFGIPVGPKNITLTSISYS